jgi:uncharacterized protein (DUF1778 family)
MSQGKSLTRLIFISILISMARPHKEPSERKSEELRIPVTEDQKNLISEAASADGADVATWLRPIVLRAAAKRLEKESGRDK